MKHYYVAPEEIVEQYLEDFRLGIVGGDLRWIHTDAQLNRLPNNFYLVCFDGDDGQLDYWESLTGVTPLPNVMAGGPVVSTAAPSPTTPTDPTTPTTPTNQDPATAALVSVITAIGCTESQTTYEVSEVARKIHSGFRFNGV